VSGISILEPFGGNDQLTISAVADHGSVTELTGDALPDSGSVEYINSVLADGIKYTPNTDPGDPTDKVTLTINDNRHDTDTVNFVFNVSGTGCITLQGVAGEKNMIFATGYNDTLTSNGGSSDTFVFRANEGGNDHITDFNTAHDVLQFDSSIYDSIMDALGSAHDDGHGDTVFTTAHNGTITLDHIAATQLTSSNIAIHSGGGGTAI
jgi:hypothetical protein